MGAGYSYVQVRIDAVTKKRASEVLAAMGLTISDVIRLLLEQVASEGRLPFELGMPNATTLEAMAELNAGGGKSFNTVEELMKDLDSDD